MEHTAPKIFDRHRLKLQRNRAAKSFATYDFLLNEAVDRLAERLDDTSRMFSSVLDIGCHTGQMQRIIGQRKGIERFIQCDIAEAMVRQATGMRVAADEEYLPFAPGSFDLVISALSLHWVNDLPGTLVQIRKLLKPDGVIFISMLGGRTLHELRHAALLAGEGRGVSPRVAPFVDVKDAGALLQRAGFSMPVADSDTVNVSYSSALRLMQDLHGMGEGNILVQSQKHLNTAEALATIAVHYPRLEDEEGIAATFEIVTMTGMR